MIVACAGTTWAHALAMCPCHAAGGVAVSPAVSQSGCGPWRSARSWWSSASLGVASGCTVRQAAYSRDVKWLSKSRSQMPTCQLQGQSSPAVQFRQVRQCLSRTDYRHTVATPQGLGPPLASVRRLDDAQQSGSLIGDRHAVAPSVVLMQVSPIIEAGHGRTCANVGPDPRR